MAVEKCSFADEQSLFTRFRVTLNFQCDFQSDLPSELNTKMCCDQAG